MSIERPKSDEERRTIADDVADLAHGISNALAVHDRDGCNLHDRMRSGLAGHPGATAYDRPVVSGHNTRTWCDVHEAETCGDDGHGCAGQYTLNTPTDTTGETALGILEHGDQAQHDLDEWDARMAAVYAALKAAERLAIRYLPRPPRRSEAELTTLAEDNADPGCESCRRVTDHDGGAHWSPTYRTGEVRAGDGTDPDTARLNRPHRLCEWCYKFAAKLPPGVQFTLAMAIPLRYVRDHALGRRVYVRADDRRAS